MRIKAWWRSSCRSSPQHPSRDNLSLALDARCYEEGATRTHWRVMRVTGMDVAVAIVVLVYLVALVVPGVLL